MTIKYNSIIFILLSLLLGTNSTVAQQADQRPKLVVGIVIDQLRSDYIDMLSDRFTAGGFRRLIDNGAYFENMTYSTAVSDPTVSSAIIFTGTYPKVNGFAAPRVFNSKTQRAVPTLTDHDKIGNFTDETYSPTGIAVSTLADEVRINSEGIGFVYSIAPDAQQAITLAGHAANSAVWLNDVTGNWATTTFYKDFPPSISFRNYNMPLATRLDTTRWVPMANIDDYPGIPKYRKFHPFRYSFPKNDKDRFRKYKVSALINEEVTSIAINFLQTLNLGRRQELDMLNIAYTAAPYEYTSDTDFHVELIDTYLRLDRELNRLFNAIDKALGNNASVIFVASTGYFKDNSIDAERFHIPTGEFYVARAKSLLNMYLIALYGNGDWVQNYYDRNLYLNSELIKQRNLSLEELRTKSAQFLRRMSGVYNAYSIDDIINNPVSDEAKRLQLATNTKYAGDVIIEILPGWQIVDPSNTSKPTLIRDNAVNSPAFIVGNGVKVDRISTEVDASFIAPTLARILGIRAPNAASHKPLILK